MRNLMLTAGAAALFVGVWLYMNQMAAGTRPDPVANSPASQEFRGVMPEVVTVEAVQYREIVDSIEAIGTTHANESVSITAKVTDTVNRVHFEDGDHVEGGQILVEMTNNEESALLAEAQANLNEARRQLTRQLDLGEKGLAAKSTVDEAIAREGAAEARFNAITARMNDRLIRAPFGGILGFREISPGTMLTSNTVITTLDDISIIKLDFSIPELYLGVVETGFRIISKSDVWKDREFEGEINSIGSRIDPVTRAVTVRAAIRNEEELLRPGMLMTVRIITDVRQALVIPESAFIQTGDESFVFVAGLDGLAHRRVIQIGARRFGFVEILEGLSAGERVITEGGFKLQDKAPYKVEDKSGINLSLEATAIRPGSI